MLIVSLCLLACPQGKEKMLAIARDIADVERSFGLSRSSDEYEEELKFGLMEVVHEWAKGKVRGRVMWVWLVCNYMYCLIIYQ